MTQLALTAFLLASTVSLAGCASHSATSRFPASARDEELATLLPEDFFGTLKHMSHTELDDLYNSGSLPAQLPLGKFDGIALVFDAQQGHGKISIADSLKGITRFAWQGKHFTKIKGRDDLRGLDNRLFFLAEAVHAEVSVGDLTKTLNDRFGEAQKTKLKNGRLEGNGLGLGMDPVRVDGRRSILIDYRHATEVTMQPIVDEIRLISVAGEDHYLGRATYNGQFGLFFALQPK